MRPLGTSLFGIPILLAATFAVAEIPPAESLPCFAGAYYRKAVSSVDEWDGLDTTVRLPIPLYDLSQVKPATGHPLDNASVYLGGSASGQEVDAGLTWSIIREKNGSVSSVGKAFRPFWRVTQWANAPAEPRYYYYPGDVIRLSVYTPEAGKLTMEVEVVERTEASKENLRALGTEEFDAFFTTTFDANGFGPGQLQEFKRVNGLDQFGNEGKPVRPTRTRIEEAEWIGAWLLRDGERLPFTAARYTDMRCPDSTHIVVRETENTAQGGEEVWLHGRSQSRPSTTMQLQ